MRKNKKKGKILKTIIIIIIVTIIIWIIQEQYAENKIIEKDTNITVSIEDNNKKNTTNEIKQYPKEQIIDNFQGYEVCAKLEIPKISLETYVLSQYSAEALNISVTKFWGADPNRSGNFCIAGHNFINKNMFRNLKKLEIGDTLSVTDNTIGKVEYEIYKIEKVIPKDTSCLNQNTSNNKEVTLITCTNDSQKRIVVKAKEII